MAGPAATDGPEELLVLVTKTLVLSEKLELELVAMLLRDAAEVLQDGEEHDASS